MIRFLWRNFKKN